jgi:hypothetical protein
MRPVRFLTRDEEEPMRNACRALGLLAVLLAPTTAPAAGYNRIYLVPALKPCPGFGSCPGRELASSYTFDTIVLRSPPGRYLPTGKPSLFLQIRGVRDGAGTAVNGNLTLTVLSGRVNVPGVGTIGDDSSLTTVAPVPIPLENGNNPKFSYKPNPQAPNGTLVNGGGVEVYDPEGKLLAVTGTQAKP